MATPEIIDLNDVISHLEKLLQRTLGEDVELTILKGENLYPVEADPAQVEQALVGMALNAREAMPDGGSLTIQTESVILDEDYVDANPAGEDRARTCA